MIIGEQKLTILFDSITITAIANHKKSVILKFCLVNQCIPMIESTFTLKEGDTMKIKGLDIKTKILMKEESEL